jgi:hypothetical protein
MLERRCRASLALPPRRRQSRDLAGLTPPQASPKPGMPGPGVQRAPTSAQTVAPRATPEPALAPVRGGGQLAKARGGTERP